MATKRKLKRNRPGRDLGLEPRHYLKSWPEHFEDVLYGVKTFEARRNDRGFEKGDLICLQEWIPDDSRFSGEYSGREVLVRVTHILYGTEDSTLYGVMEGFCVMSIKRV